jgi:ATP-dependent DNA helicase RecQ
MTQYALDQIKDLINLLIAEGYLMLTEDEYPVVKLQKKAVDVLKNKEQVFQKIHYRVKETTPDKTLFEQLRFVRKEISARQQVPPYVIFPDSTLNEMSQHYPITLSELAQIKGVGQAKLEKYGEEFIQVIQAYVNEHPEALEMKDKHQEKVISASNSEDIPSHIVTLDMYHKGIGIADISKQRGLKPITIQEHLLRCCSEGMDINLDDFIPAEHEALMIRTGAQKLKPIKEALPEMIDYMAIKAVLLKMNVADHPL